MFMRVTLVSCVACVLMVGNLHAQSRMAADPNIVDQLQLERQAIVQNGKINVPQFSRDILTTTSAAEGMDRAGNDAGAMAELKTLEKYAPLSEIPSYNVQMLCSWLYMKLGDQTNANACKQRASAMFVILHQRSGGGLQPGDPVRVIMTSDMVEWGRSQLGNAVAAQPYRYNGIELQEVTFTGLMGGSKPTTAFFAIDPRVAAVRNRTVTDIFAPLPLANMPPLQLQAFNDAQAKRIQFLADKSFNYSALINLCRSSLKEAKLLESQGDNAGAMAALRNVGQIRPIDDTPLVDLIATYSALLGKVGDAAGQSKERLYLFGILQSIAHSGDGLSAQTAIHVIAVAEEYTWLGQKKLHLQKQSLINANGRQYDAMQAADAQGNSLTYYFDVSDFIAREGGH